MDGLLRNEGGDGGLADLLADYDNIPVVELVGDEFDGVLGGSVVADEGAHLIEEPDVDFGQGVH